MYSHLKRFLLVLVIASAALSARAFTPLGPFDTWQVFRIGYGPAADIGGPMNLGEEYRWNLKTIYFGFDESFLNYFGTQGTNAVIKAIDILNSLPAVSDMSTNLSEFPLNTTRENPTAAALGLLDVKSMTLALLMEEIGLASPSRYTWTLRSRIEPGPIYTIIKRNFDPVTLSPSSFVNGVLYTFTVQEFVGPFADAVEVQIDPTRPGFTAVADGGDGLFSFLAEGQYYTGLTRDDVAGIRYLYRPENYQFEQVISNATAAVAGSGGSPWDPIGGGGTNGVATNNFVNVAVRGGLDKLSFKLGKYDSFIGSFITITNVFSDTYVTNSGFKTQSLQRVLVAPDILFEAEDLGVDAGGVPLLVRRTDTAGWANNDALNGQSALAGPGVIEPQVEITFSKVGPYFIDVAPAFVDLTLPVGGIVWGSFDGTTNNPIIYPIGTSIFDYENQVLIGGDRNAPYSIPNSGLIITNTP